MWASLLAAVIMTAFSLTACSDDDNPTEEFPNWKATNERAFAAVYATATSQEGSENAVWKRFNVYSKDASSGLAPEDYVVIREITKGKDSGSPLFTDTVSIHYRGRLLPSTTYTEGYVFDSSWEGDYDLPAMKPFSSLAVSQYVDGMATALQHMKIGDRWEIYIPYQLGYGSSGTMTSTIPPYSMLIFVFTLVGYHR